MKKIYLLAAFLLSACLAFAQQFDPNNNTEGREVWGEEANRIWQGAEHIWLKQENTIPSFIEFRVGSEPSELPFFIIAKRLYKLPSNYDFKLIRDEQDDIGWQHKRFQLTVDGIPVCDAIFILHMKEGKVKKYNGFLFKNVNIPNAPILNEGSALNFALENIKADVYKWQVPGEDDHLKQTTGEADATYYPKGKLEIVQVGDITSDVFKLAWKFDIYAHQPVSRNDVFVDALTGEVLRKNPRLYNVNTNGTAVTVYRGTRPIVGDSYNSQYRLYETTRGKGVHTWNLRKGTSFGAAVEFTDADNVWNNVNVNLDQYAGDAHWGAEMTYDFYKLMGRNSIDGNGYALNLYMHYDVDYVNAFWDGREMTFGDGDGNPYTPLVSLDITGHEISHGLDERTADLTYLNESGALNESFSDIFGTAVEWFADSTKGNWTIGEDIGGYFRNMANPNNTGDPDTYKGTNWYSGTADNGGVHTNSSVQNFWYYLLWQGGSGTNDIGSVYSVTGLGRHKATQIAWRNMVYYLTSASKYADARMYAIQSAGDLFGNCSPEVASTTRAWYAVGVGANYTSGAQAQFTGTPVASCSAPLVVNFTNTSSNGNSYFWSFGDNTTSTLANPSHTYSALGTYTVKLVVSGGNCGKDSLTRTNYISVSTSNPCTVILPASGAYQTQTSCTGTIYDNGGSTANYTDLSNSIITISPTGAARVRLHFTQFSMENGYDFLYVYDGPTTNGTLLGTYTGTTIPADITSTGASITIRQASDNFVTAAGFTVQWTCIAPTIAPVANFMADATSTCTGNVQFTDLTLNGATSWLWNFGDGITSTLRNPLHQYLVSGSYTVSLKATNSFGNNTATKTNYIVVAKPAAPVGVNSSNCSAGSFTLSSTSTNKVAWFDSTGNMVSTQNPFITPNLSKTTTYWVQDSVPQAIDSVGKIDNSTGGGGYFNNPSSAFLALRFNVMKPCKLVSVYVYALGAGYRTIQYRDAAGGVIAQRTVNCPNGGSRITLNFDLIPGGPYELGIKDTMNLWRNQGGTTWPYNDPDGMVSITGNNTYLLGGQSAPQNYYYFYNWYLQGQDCVSERTPVTATVGAGLNITMAPVNPTCFGTTNGSASVAISGGTPQYTYKWSNGQTTASATNLAQGAVTVTITDGTGCSSTATKTLTQPAAISPVATSTNISCFGGSNGTINMAVTGGTPNYIYNWGGGISTQNRTGLTQGTYTVTITDASSCSATATKTLTQPTLIAPATTATNVTCFGGSNGAVNLAVTGGTPNYTYNWGGGVTTQNRTGLPQGTYTVTITDAASCSITATKTVTQPTAIAPVLTGANVTCNGGNTGTVNLAVTGGTPNYTYNWGAGITTQNRTGLSAGTYTVTVTDAANCTSTASRIVSQPPVINIGLTKTDARCSSFIGSATATASGGNAGPYSYLWSNSKTSAAITSLRAGSYTVTVSDKLNCTASATVIVNDTFALTTTPSSSNVSCFGSFDGSAQVMVSNGTPPYAYQWTSGDTTATAINLPAGIYNVVIADSNECHGIATVTITQPAKIDFALLVKQPTCVVASAGSASVIVANGQPGYSVKWSNHVDADSITNLSPGNYSLTVTDGNDCAVDSSFTITNAPTLSLSYTARNVSCFGGQNGSAVIHSSGGSDPYVYIWNGNNTATDTIRNLQAGTYIITVTDDGDCSATVSVSISQPPLFTISTSFTQSVQGQNNGTATIVTLDGGTSPYSFKWSNGATTQTISGLAPGNYTVTATDHNGCQQLATVTIGVASGIETLDENISFRIYPNPANTEAVIEIKEPGRETTISLKNILGQPVLTQNVSSDKTTIDLSTFAAGIYLVEIQKGEHRATKQLVVVRQ